MSQQTDTSGPGCPNRQTPTSLTRRPVHREEVVVGAGGQVAGHLPVEVRVRVLTHRLGHRVAALPPVRHLPVEEGGDEGRDVVVDVGDGHGDSGRGDEGRCAPVRGLDLEGEARVSLVVDVGLDADLA